MGTTSSRMKKLIYFTIIVFLIIISTFFYLSLQNKNTINELVVTENKIETESSKLEAETKIIYVSIGGQKLKVDLAISDLEKQKGLSVKEILPEDEGMLFLFDQPRKYAFWMKDMKFDIDILWLDKDGQIVYIAKNVTPESYPKTFIPSVDASYVLEVVSGFSTKNNLKVGDKVEFIQ